MGTRRGLRVRVYEREPGGQLYVSIWMPGQGERRASLSHRNKQRALFEAEELVKLRLAELDAANVPPPLTLGILFRRYVAEGKHLPDGSLKTKTYLRHVTQTGRFLKMFFGPGQRIGELTPDRIREYIVWRREGGAGEGPVGTNTLQRDLGMFKAALNWAGQTYEAGRPLLTGHVLEKFKIPSEKDPKRPVVDEATIWALLEVAPAVHPFLRFLIMLAWRTGRRLSSVLALRWEDIDFEKGMIRWRAEHDKIRQTWVVPARQDLLDELLRFRTAHPGIGPALLFPHPRQRRHRGKPVDRHLASYWLKEAFRRGKIAKPAGSLWHMFRRVWATERKDLPLKDVAAAGGWRDTSTLLRYQQPDEDTLRSVVEFERPRAPRPAAKAVGNSLSNSLTPRR
ncbi:MAG TPA: site-specific integrase [Gemmatimonadales bacterium]|nr:site-specific integrase [Gemmatimonadales bacterium]